MNIPIHKHTPVRRHMSGYLIIISSRGASINKGAKRPVHTGTTKVKPVYLDANMEQYMREKGIKDIRYTQKITYECNPDESQKWQDLKQALEKNKQSRWFRLFNRRGK